MGRGDEALEVKLGRPVAKYVEGAEGEVVVLGGSHLHRGREQGVVLGGG